MYRSDLRRMSEIFNDAKERPPEDRDKFLKTACGGDAALRDEIDRLLAVDNRAGEFLNPPSQVDGDEAMRAPEVSVPTHIGEYRIKRRIAAGGMGVIYEAEQKQPQRSVALKVMRGGITSKSAMKRFEFEAQLLARLRHPAIAQIYEAGTHDDGVAVVPYFVMEYIPQAAPITRYAETNDLTMRQRLKLFQSVCEAVHHGHQKGISHRDLKPSNILVDSDGRPKVIDFGVARSTDSDMTVTTLEESVGKLIGTLQYMSPEQCGADPHDVDSRSDVYALGAVLYQLLSGRLPYDLKQRTLPDAIRVINDVQPTPLGSVRRVFRGDIEYIVAKALEKDRDRRYQSAEALASDIERFLSGLPISARPASTSYHVRKFAARNKILVGSITVAFLALVGGIVATQVGWQRATQAERDARFGAYRARIAAAAAALRENDPVAARQYLATAPAEFRHWEWRHYQSQVDVSRMILRGHTDEVSCVAFSSDGTVLASGSRDGTVRLWNLEVGTSTVLLHSSGVTRLSFSPDGRRLLTGCADGAVHMWDWSKATHKAEWHEQSDRITALAFDPGGTRFVAASRDRTLRVYAVSGGSSFVLYESAGRVDEIYSVRFSPNGSRLLATTADGTCVWWDSESWKRVERVRVADHILYATAISPDGKLVALAASGRTVYIVDATAQPRRQLRGHEGHVLSVCFDPSGSRIASASRDETIRLWNVGTGEMLAVLGGHAGPVNAVAWSPDGSLIASGSADSTVRLWDGERRAAVAVLEGHTNFVYPVVFSPDGALVASGGWDNEIRIWDPVTSQSRVLAGHGKEITSLSFSPDSKRIASGSFDFTIRLWDLHGATKPKMLTGHEEVVYGVAFSPDGARLASASWDKTIRLWNAATGQMETVLSDHSDQVYCIAFSHDGRLLASGSADRTVRLWDVQTDRPVQVVDVLEGHQDTVWSIAFSSDDRWLVSASRDRTIRLWDTRTGKCERVLRGHTGEVYGVTFTPDGRRIASSSEDQTIRLWDSATGEVTAELRGHDSYVYSVAFSPDGTTLASGSGDRTVRLWGSVLLRERSANRGDRKVRTASD